jgi:hypothetical protein
MYRDETVEWESDDEEDDAADKAAEKEEKKETEKDEKIEMKNEGKESKSATGIPSFITPAIFSLILGIFSSVFVCFDDEKRKLTHTQKAQRDKTLARPYIFIALCWFLSLFIGRADLGI